MTLAGTAPASAGAPLIASYFAIGPNAQTDESWPSKLTFVEAAPISLDEFRKRIQGEWRVVFHCGGRRLGTAELRENRILDGVSLPGIDYVFTGETARFRLLPTKRYGGPLPDRSGAFGVTQSAPNTFLLSFAREIGIYPLIFHVAKVVETGEDIIEMFEPESDTSPVPHCDADTLIKTLLVPVSPS